MNTQEVKEKLYSLGADLCGIASLDRFNEAPLGYHPLDVLPTCKSVIVFAIRFVSGTLACNTAVPYTVVRNILSDKMDKIAVQFCIDLEDEGIPGDIGVLFLQNMLHKQLGWVQSEDIPC